MKGYRSKATPPRPSQGRGMKVNGPLGPRGRFSCAPQVLRRFRPPRNGGAEGGVKTIDKLGVQRLQPTKSINNL